MKTALIHSDDFLLHDTGNHPERSERYVSILQGLRAEQELWEDLVKLSPRVVTDEEILRCHERNTIATLQHACLLSHGERIQLDADTVVSDASDHVARLAAGGICQAIDEVMSTTIRRAFVACRPPGHHATVRQ